MSDWSEQFNRMRRWGERLDEPMKSKDEVLDTFYAFAQACYHLVDWLENDKSPSQPIDRQRADQHVWNTPELRLCKQICDGSKHGVLTTRSEPTPGIEILGFEMGDSPDSLDEMHYRVTVLVRIDDILPGTVPNTVPCTAFAEWCIESWTMFLADNGLPVGYV